MKLQRTNPEHEIAYQDLVALCAKHADKLSERDILLIAANMLGKLIAMQDQRTMTPKEALELVGKNIEYGNQQVLELLSNTAGKA